MPPGREYVQVKLLLHITRDQYGVSRVLCPVCREMLGWYPSVYEEGSLCVNCWSIVNTKTGETWVSEKRLAGVVERALT